MEYILTVMIWFYGSQGAMLATATYNSYEACEDAGKRHIEALNTGMRRGAYLCTEKGLKK